MLRKITCNTKQRLIHKFPSLYAGTITVHVGNSSLTDSTACIENTNTTDYKQELEQQYGCR
jgi:hypothetical protein